jgi:hypothetical protein
VEVERGWAAIRRKIVAYIDGMSGNSEYAIAAIRHDKTRSFWRDARCWHGIYRTQEMLPEEYNPFRDMGGCAKLWEFR